MLQDDTNGLLLSHWPPGTKYSYQTSSSFVYKYKYVFQGIDLPIKYQILVGTKLVPLFQFMFSCHTDTNFIAFENRFLKTSSALGFCTWLKCCELACAAQQHCTAAGSEPGWFGLKPSHLACNEEWLVVFYLINPHALLPTMEVRHCSTAALQQVASLVCLCYNHPTWLATCKRSAGQFLHFDCSKEDFMEMHVQHCSGPGQVGSRHNHLTQLPTCNRSSKADFTSLQHAADAVVDVQRCSLWQARLVHVKTIQPGLQRAISYAACALACATLQYCSPAAGRKPGW